MPRTTFVDGVTEVTAAWLNGATEHVHDGTDADGHVDKIAPDDHIAWEDHGLAFDSTQETDGVSGIVYRFLRFAATTVGQEAGLILSRLRIASLKAAADYVLVEALGIEDSKVRVTGSGLSIRNLADSADRGLTVGAVDATGNVTTSGNVVATGDITGDNATLGGDASVTGNVSAGGSVTGVGTVWGAIRISLASPGVYQVDADLHSRVSSLTYEGAGEVSINLASVPPGNASSNVQPVFATADNEDNASDTGKRNVDVYWTDSNTLRVSCHNGTGFVESPMYVLIPWL